MQKIAPKGVVALFVALCLQMDVSVSLSADPEGAPIPATPPFASPDIKPTLADWITARPVALGKKILYSDPLQKPPFVGQPPDSLKGMAAGIRAVQLDVPNRIKAAAYLGTVDCVTYPQAQGMLIATMMEDPSEEVRYEAVMALRMMLAAGCNNMDTMCECDTCANRKQISRETIRHSHAMQRKVVAEAKCHAKIAAWKAKRAVAKKEQRYDCCRGCSNAKVIKALAEVAYGKDDQCCFIEPSERVREAAKDGLCLAAIAPAGMGNFYSADPVPTEKIDEEPTPPGEVMPRDDEEVAPPLEPEAIPKDKAATSIPKKAPVRNRMSQIKSTPGKASVANSSNPMASPVTVEEPAIATQPAVEAVQAAPVIKSVPVVATPAAVETATQPYDDIPALNSTPVAFAAPVVKATPVVNVATVQKSIPVVPATIVKTTPADGLPALSDTPKQLKLASNQTLVADAPVLAALNGHCIVCLKNRQFVLVTNQYSSVFEGHTYHFASREAKATFDADPSRFAPAYGGIDPVEFLDNHTMVEGQFLREFDDRFYMFTNKEHWDTFKATPGRFILPTAKSSPNLAGK